MNVWETFHFNVTWERFLWFLVNVLGTFWERKIVGWAGACPTVSSQFLSTNMLICMVVCKLLANSWLTIS